jgi:F-type H+-transporting ATPase subunit b
MKIEVQLGTMVVMIMNFLVLMAVLIRLLYRPIQGMLEQRRQKIVKDLDEAKNTRETADRLQHQARIVLEEAHVEAYETVEKSKIEADRLREELYNQVTREVEQLRSRARDEVERSKQLARDEVREEAVDLALLATTKILGAQMNKNLDMAIIRDVLDDLTKEAKIPDGLLGN